MRLFEECVQLSSSIRKTTSNGNNAVSLLLQGAHLLLHFIQNEFFLLMIFVQTAHVQIILAQTPIDQIIVERNDANIVDQMKFSRSVKVDHRNERTWTAFEEEFVFR